MPFQHKCDPELEPLVMRIKLTFRNRVTEVSNSNLWLHREGDHTPEKLGKCEGIHGNRGYMGATRLSSVFSKTDGIALTNQLFKLDRRSPIIIETCGHRHGP